jgi:hypothetical protein
VRVGGPVSFGRACDDPHGDGRSADQAERHRQPGRLEERPGTQAAGPLQPDELEQGPHCDGEAEQPEGRQAGPDLRTGAPQRRCEERQPADDEHDAQEADDPPSQGDVLAGAGRVGRQELFERGRRPRRDGRRWIVLDGRRNLCDRRFGQRGRRDSGGGHGERERALNRVGVRGLHAPTDADLAAGQRGVEGEHETRSVDRRSVGGRAELTGRVEGDELLADRDRRARERNRHLADRLGHDIAVAGGRRLEPGVRVGDRGSEQECGGACQHDERRSNETMRHR